MRITKLFAGALLASGLLVGSSATAATLDPALSTKTMTSSATVYVVATLPGGYLELDVVATPDLAGSCATVLANGTLPVAALCLAAGDNYIAVPDTGASWYSVSVGGCGLTDEDDSGVNF